MTVLWGISFDATPISGVVVEFVKTARHFRDRGYEVHLDLGYDVKADKNAFFRPYRDEAVQLPDWIRLDRVDELSEVPGYDQEFVATVLREYVRDGAGAHLLPRVHAAADAVAERLVATWERRGVSFVMVENGTLPENITYTMALYSAIERYGRRHRLGPFVLWRDHDLMWQSEPGTGKYGTFPYPSTVAPVNSPYIRYVALHEEARRRTLEWVPDLRNITVLPNTFAHTDTDTDTHAAGGEERERAGFRRHFGIPQDAPLIARFTRIIPQKRIDRDIHLLARLPERAGDVHLFVAGDTQEAPDEHARLVRLAESLGVAGRVVFGGRLAPHESGVPAAGDEGHSVRDLLAEAQLASFLTSYDYESYGNPVGEAIASRVPYLTTRYQLYDTVYGDKGFRAPVMELTDGDLPTAAFVDSVAELILDERKREQMADFNHRLGKRHFGEDTAGEVLDELFLPPMGERTRMSVVLPVYNEAANLPAVLASLHGQRGPEGPLDRDLYEVVLVDNNSTDDTVAIARRFAADHPDLALHIVPEPEQGVACARKTGMDFAAQRSRRRAGADPEQRFYLVSADADCRVDARWLWELLSAMDAGKAAIGVCDYYYEPEHFTGRPRLWDAIQRTLRCRAVTFSLFGGFPDGKGFAVDRDAYEKVGGIEIFYQLQNGRFVNHLSDDWDFGILVRGSGEDITYVPASRVEINPRRVNHAIDEVITGRAYGSDGIIVMRDIRIDGVADGESGGPDGESGGGLGAADGGGTGSEAASLPETASLPDLTEEEARQAWEFSVKDFTPKNTILPVLLTPSLLDDDAVAEFFGPSLTERLGRRIAEITEEMRVVDFTPIHSYKTPSYRLYFEFADEIFARLRATVGEDIGHPPPLPPCLRDVPQERFTEFVRYYCEDRESGEAHNYFGNGGVF
ncbi:glycosyltransferase involved in cell wall biosynthesis [Streptomyces sp. Amel2xB2]|uniref:glycosyltransferase n=1 Tax=Streptomyces sp. Amel2xB2 TaxID=1305829 RepID=UPI000DBA8D97|nr:glycosyltransferase [Streptomyces sp. Amel2xB2]RAJ68870.1 glycosyltransferase involved in cell wall biosynthesis [Streptomyces sp. Amel2xB2]